MKTFPILVVCYLAFALLGKSAEPPFWATNVHDFDRTTYRWGYSEGRTQLDDRSGVLVVELPWTWPVQSKMELGVHQWPRFEAQIYLTNTTANNIWINVGFDIAVWRTNTVNGIISNTTEGLLFAYACSGRFLTSTRLAANSESVVTVVQQHDYPWLTEEPSYLLSFYPRVYNEQYKPITNGIIAQIAGRFDTSAYMYYADGSSRAYVPYGLNVSYHYLVPSTRAPVLSIANSSDDLFYRFYFNWGQELPPFGWKQLPFGWLLESKEDPSDTAWIPINPMNNPGEPIRETISGRLTEMAPRKIFRVRYAPTEALKIFRESPVIKPLTFAPYW